MIRKEAENVSIKYKLYLLLYERIEEKAKYRAKRKSRMLLKRILAPVVQGTKINVK